MQSLSNCDIYLAVLKRVDGHLASLTSKLDEQLNLFAASCSQAPISMHKSNSGTVPVTPASSATSPVDRSRNVIISPVSRRVVFLMTGVMPFHVFLRLLRVGRSISRMHSVLADLSLENADLSSLS